MVLYAYNFVSGLGCDSCSADVFAGWSPSAMISLCCLADFRSQTLLLSVCLSVWTRAVRYNISSMVRICCYIIAATFLSRLLLARPCSRAPSKNDEPNKNLTLTSNTFHGDWLRLHSRFGHEKCWAVRHSTRIGVQKFYAVNT